MYISLSPYENSLRQYYSYFRDLGTDAQRGQCVPDLFSVGKTEFKYGLLESSVAMAELCPGPTFLPKIIRCRVNLVPQDVAVFGERAFKEVIKDKGSH